MLFTSEITGKSYKTVEELEMAEKQVAEAKAKADAEKAAKTKELASLNEAANAYLALVNSNAKIRANLDEEERAAYNKYKAELNKFAEAHNGYHLTYKKNGDSIEFEVEDVRQERLEAYHEEQKKLVRAILNNFWF